MPWDCRECGQVVALDTTSACPSCGRAKMAWSLAHETRQFVVKTKRFELLRGVEPRALPRRSASDLGLVPALRVRAVPHARLRRWALEERAPPPSRVLVVRLHPQGHPDLTVTVGVKPASGEVREVALTPTGAGPLEVRLLFACGEGPAAPADAFAGVTIVDVSEATALGHAPEVELSALRRPPRALPVAHDDAVAPGSGVVLPGALFAFDSAFPGPSLPWSLEAVADALEADAGARLAVFGHADPRGDDAANKRVTDQRARAVLALLTQDLAAFEAAAAEDGWGAREQRVMLRALGHPDREATRATIRAFQREYNAGTYHEGALRPRALGPLPVDGRLAPDTAAALRDAYLARSAILVPPERLAPAPLRGCGALNRTSADAAVDRRVSVAIVTTAGATAPPCRAGDAAACLRDQDAPVRCSFYARAVLDDVHLPAPASPPARAAARVVRTLELVGLDPDGREVPAHPRLLARSPARFRAKLDPPGDAQDAFTWSTSTGARLRLGEGATADGPEVQVTGLVASDTPEDAHLKVTWTRAGRAREVEHDITVEAAGLRLLFAPSAGSALPGRSGELLRGPFEVEEGGQRQAAHALPDGSFALRPGAVLLALEGEYEVRAPGKGEPTGEQMLAQLGYRLHQDLTANVLRFQYDHGLPTTARLDRATCDALRRRLA